MKRKKQRDVEKGYTRQQLIARLHRLVKALERGERFTIQVAGERIRIPSHAVINIEHERGRQEEEVEFQIKWKRKPKSQ